MKKRKKMRKKKIFSKRTLLLALAGIIIGFSFYTWNAAKLVGNKLPMPFGYGMSVVLTGSMSPTLEADDLVFVKKTDNFKKDDIVVYQSGSSLVIHRVMEINGDELITKGDANNACDAPINKKTVLGVMVGHIDGAGRIIDFIRQPVVVAMIILLIFVLAELSFHKEKKNDRDEIEKMEEEIKALLDELKK